MTDLSKLPPRASSALVADAARLDFYLDAELAPETKRAYSSDWQRYEAWSRSRRLDPQENRPPAVAIYLATLADAGKSLSTVDRSLSSISYAYLVLKYDSPRLAPVVRRVMKGIRRTLGGEQDRASPIMPADLRRMVDDGCKVRNPVPKKQDSVLHASRLRRALRDRALLTVGFAGAFRRSELSSLCWRDVQLVDEGLKVTIRSSKTDKKRVGQTIGLPYGGHLQTCPVRSLLAWKVLLGGDDVTGPVFRPILRDGTIPYKTLSPRAIAKVIQRTAHHAGVEGRISGHSLRAGLATAAAKAGKPAHTIMRQTRHKTVEMIMRYIRDEGIWDDNAAAGIGL